MRMWFGPRLRRGDFIFAVIALNLAYFAAIYFAQRGFSLTLNFGTRTTPALWGSEPVIVTAIKLVHDIVMISLCYRRLQDANYQGWYVLAAFAVLVALSFIPGIGTVAALAALIGMIALLFLPPTIGPNRFGADPRGWKSAEHYREQQQRLAKGE